MDMYNQMMEQAVTYDRLYMQGGPGAKLWAVSAQKAIDLALLSISPNKFLRVRQEFSGNYKALYNAGYSFEALK